MRYFNTSGPNISEQHYTLYREDLLRKGTDLVTKERYFTIWAPRQTGKSTFFLQLKAHLETQGYQCVVLNFENFRDASLITTLNAIRTGFERTGLELPPNITSFADFSDVIIKMNTGKIVIVVDEVEGLNPALFGQFLHTIRNLYHSRSSHVLKSVILVGVSNIVGVVEDHASPFNIADNFPISYFSDEETFALLQQHETETGQKIETKVKEKISEITANQPGLVNGFAYQLVSRYPEKPTLDYSDYLVVEDWYLMEALDKNFANILKWAKKYRELVETLLFTEQEIPFDIDRESIKILHTNGLIKRNASGNVEFWVPFYKKRLQKALYPYTNGERDHISENLYAPDFFTPNGELKLETLIDTYKAYAKRRGFAVFREKDAQGNYTSIKEAGLLYSFETFMAAFVSEAGGKTYREADVGLGKSDLIINLSGKEILFEAKKYYSPAKFLAGKTQFAYYASRLGLSHAVYLVFAPIRLKYPEPIKEGTERIEQVEINTFLVPYDEVKDF
jgi:AAA-like domain